MQIMLLNEHFEIYHTVSVTSDYEVDIVIMGNDFRNYSDKEIYAFTVL